MRMKRLVAVIAIGLFAAACASHQDLQRPAAQDDFGVQMAKMNLWREAMFRFKRAVQIDPADARAHNNLAVALEATGDFENARKEYLEALKLDRGNAYIQKNYSRFVEFLSRNRKRESKDAKTAGPVMPKPSAPTMTDATPPQYPPPPGSNEPPKPVPGGAPPSDRPPPSAPRPPVPMPTPPPVPPPGGSR
jgi:tetratricopeptide (TPR) repeat protein